MNERELAEALGLRLSDEPMEWFTASFVFQKRRTRCWIDAKGQIQSCGEDLPDFSTADWQVKIWERVEELCDSLEYSYSRDVVTKYRLVVHPASVPRHMAFYSDTKREAWEAALLWAYRQKAGKT